MKSETSERVAGEWDKAGRGLCRAGAVAILIAVVLFRRNYGVELVTFKGFGIWQGVPEVYPRTVLEWFSIFTSHPFVGLNLFGLEFTKQQGRLFLRQTHQQDRRFSQFGRHGVRLPMLPVSGSGGGVPGARDPPIEYRRARLGKLKRLFRLRQ